MGIVVNVSEPGLDYMLYGNKSELIGSYIANQMAAIQPGFNDFSRRVYQSLQNSYNFVTDKLTQYGIMNQIAQQGIMVTDNYYQELLTFQALQHANPVMQRWVMAHPVVRQMHLDQDIDGYSETYKNVFGKGVGEEDYNYRRVMDGVLTDDKDGETSTVKFYLEDLMPGDKELDHYEKARVLHTWDAIDHILTTSQFDFTLTSEELVKRNRR